MTSNKKFEPQVKMHQKDEIFKNNATLIIEKENLAAYEALSQITPSSRMRHPKWKWTAETRTERTNHLGAT